MERNKTNKKNIRAKGITLVALIITIIVMLILVAVSIQVVINSDLIGTAQDAGNRTETKYQEEGNMSEITVGNTTYESIDKYINPGKTITFYVNGTPYTAIEGWDWKTFVEQDSSGNFNLDGDSVMAKVKSTLFYSIKYSNTKVQATDVIIDQAGYDAHVAEPQ